MSSFILEGFFVSGAEPTWLRWIQYSIMTKSQQSPGSRTLFKGWVGCWRICLKPLVMFQTFTLETSWIQPRGWRKCRSCSHTSQDKGHYGSESSLLLTILSAPPPPPPTPPIAHTLCTISEMIRGRLASACLPAQAMSFTPSWALSTAPQLQSLQGDRWRNNHPGSERNRFPTTLEKFSLWGIKDSLQGSWSHSRIIIMFSLWKWTFGAGLFLSPQKKKWE